MFGYGGNHLGRRGKGVKSSSLLGPPWCQRFDRGLMRHFSGSKAQTIPKNTLPRRYGLKFTANIFSSQPLPQLFIVHPLPFFPSIKSSRYHFPTDFNVASSCLSSQCRCRILISGAQKTLIDPGRMVSFALGVIIKRIEVSRRD